MTNVGKPGEVCPDPVFLPFCKFTMTDWAIGGQSQPPIADYFLYSDFNELLYKSAVQCKSLQVVFRRDK
jgi:hypothetical protein